MTDTPQPKFEEVVKRLLSTPPKPHNAPKGGGAKGPGEDAKRAKRTAGRGRARVGKSDG